MSSIAAMVEGMTREQKIDLILKLIRDLGFTSPKAYIKAHKFHIKFRG